MKFPAAALKRFSAFVHERHEIYVRKERGEPPPWTQDPVLQQYRFCNVYRNLDKETKLIHEHWLQPHLEDENLWFAMVVARLVNWWPSLAEIGYPVPWRGKGGGRERFLKAMARRKAAGEKVFTGAYMIHADANYNGSKAEYLAAGVLDPLWEARHHVAPREGDTLDDFHKRLMSYRDMGSFMAGQVVADVKYADGGWLSQDECKDWWTWATSGPGSMKGLSWVICDNPDSQWTERTWRLAFADFQAQVAPYLKALPRISGQDLQNCLCEYSKWRRGTSRSKYRAAK